jgi:hypothetical protein
MKHNDSQQRTSNPLTSRQLFEISQKISNSFNHRISSDISELVILPVDPYHLYAYWHLDDQQLIDVKTDSNQKLLLKIYWKNEQDRKQDPSKLWFNVDLDATRNQQKIRLPVNASHYSATIGTLDENQCWNSLVHSNTIHIPAASMQPNIQNMEATQTNDVQLVIAANNKKSTESTTNPVFDEVLIDTLIQQTLHEKGLISKLENKPFSLKSHFAASNFSGQNFHF